MKSCTTSKDSSACGPHTIFGKALPHGCTRIADGNKQRTNMTHGDRLLSYREFAGIWAIILCVVLAVQLCTGCAYRSPAMYSSGFGNLYVAEQSDITTIAHGFGLPTRWQYAGFNWRDANTIFVRYHWWYDRPDFWVLGHEIWHDEKLGGYFHK
jgi:hypothetical protein